MHFKDEISEKELVFDIPDNTIEPAWRFMDRHSDWVFRRVLGGTPIAFRYRKAESRRQIIEGLKYARRDFADHTPYKNHIKIIARWPFYLLLILRNDIEPMPSSWTEDNAPMSVFCDWHAQHFQGSGTHSDPSRTEPTSTPERPGFTPMWSDSDIEAAMARNPYETTINLRGTDDRET